jgi:hypothetical protein
MEPAFQDLFTAFKCTTRKTPVKPTACRKLMEFEKGFITRSLVLNF